jgi:oligopeptide transport system ATP-binding protein
MALLSVELLRTSFHTRNGIVRAVRDVSFTLEKGETLGIVGESGSGKSVSCYSMMRLIPTPPGRIEGGRVLFDEKVDLLSCSMEELNRIRGKRISMIFQDPMTSLNPYIRVEDQLIEPLLIHGKINRGDAVKQGIAMLRDVGIQDPERRIRGYPHEFSGGMRQRVMIAMALITKPDLLIADEPTTALDVTVQAQILELIRTMQRQLGTAVIFISHDLGVVAGFCDRVLVMYAGQIVESARTSAIFQSTKHPYTQALRRSIPALQPKGGELYTIPGLPPDLSRPLNGCPFAPRCEFAVDYCRNEPAVARPVSPDHLSACLRIQKGDLQL